MADKFQAEHAMKEDYLPTGPRPDNQVRVANALDYIAYHIGQIDKKLDEVVKALTAMTRQG